MTNRVTPRTLGVDIVESQDKGAIWEDILGNSRGILTPQRASRECIPPRGAHWALGQPLAMGSHGTQRDGCRGRQGCGGILGHGPWPPPLFGERDTAARRLR